MGEKAFQKKIVSTLKGLAKTSKTEIKKHMDASE